MNPTQFRERLHALSAAWSARDYTRAAAMFATDVVYVDPLRYRMTSRDQLQRFFQDDGGLPQCTMWHTIVFDEAAQHGAAEYSYTGNHTYHGVVLIDVDRDGLLRRWREYQHVVGTGWAEWWGAAVE